MSALVLDAGALVAVDRGDRALLAMLRTEHTRGKDVRTNAMVVSQVWRDGRGRQAQLASLLSRVDVRAVDDDMGRAAGVLVAAAGTADPIDATVVLVARPGDTILTSDPRDIRRLVDAARVPVAIVDC